MNSMQNAMEVIAADTGKCAAELHQRLNRVYDIHNIICLHNIRLSIAMQVYWDKTTETRITKS